jgi:mitotic spindle assembly checkpoint protein MAD2
MVKKYGLPMLLTSDKELQAYLSEILKQVQGSVLQISFSLVSPVVLDRCFADTPATSAEWLLTSTINRLVLAITSKETRETLERWQFDIVQEKEENGDAAEDTASSGDGVLTSPLHEPTLLWMLR